MKDLNFEIKGNNTIEIHDEFKPKKITGSKLAGILGIGTSSLYNSPFTIWCEMTGVYKQPFEENIYTAAGKEIEPKIAKYFKELYGLNTLYSPSEYLGQNKDFAWDFYLDDKIFGGKWDYVYTNPEDKKKNIIKNPFTDEIMSQETEKDPIYKIIECKTAQAKKRAMWDEKVPDEYYIQLGEYCWKEKVSKGLFLVAFLNDEDYDKPAGFKCTKENTLAVPVEYDLDKYKEFYIDPALKFWNEHIVTGISPKFNPDSEIDAKYLNAIKAKLETKKEFEANSTISLEDLKKSDMPFY